MTKLTLEFLESQVTYSKAFIGDTGEHCYLVEFCGGPTQPLIAPKNSTILEARRLCLERALGWFLHHGITTEDRFFDYVNQDFKGFDWFTAHSHETWEDT